MRELYSETKILELFLEGSEEAFRHIFERYHKSIYVTAHHFLENKDLADQIVEEVFSNAVAQAR